MAEGRNSKVGIPGNQAMTLGNASASVASGGLVVICIEVSESLVEPMCSTRELQNELVPYVLSQSLQNAKFLKLSKDERKLRVKALTQKMLGGDGCRSTDMQGTDEGDISPVRFWAYLRAKYGTRLKQISATLRHLEPRLRNQRVLVLLFEGEVSAASASLLVRASKPCGSDTKAVEAAAASARREFMPSDFDAASLETWLEEAASNGCRALPLWGRLAEECSRTGTPLEKTLVLLLCAETDSTDTSPETLMLAAHLLHRLGGGVPCLSGITFGSQSSERLAALEEICAWGGGLSFNVREPNRWRSAAEGLVAHLFSVAEGFPAKAFDERREFYCMKQKLGTCFLTLPSLSRVGVGTNCLAMPVSPFSSVEQGTFRPHKLVEIVNGSESCLDGVVSSERMLSVLSDVSLSLARRWGRGLRCWRENRGLRDVVFSEPGGLGLEICEPELTQGDPMLHSWRLRATHPPASALKMQENSVLVAINQVQVSSHTPRSEVSRRLAARPVCVTFRCPDRSNGGAGSTSSLEATTLMSVVAEIAVAELREGFPPIKTGSPPLSTMLQRVAASKTSQARCVRLDQANRIISEAVAWVIGGDAASVNETQLRCLHEPDLLCRVLLYCGEVCALARCSLVCARWQRLIVGGVAPERTDVCLARDDIEESSDSNAKASQRRLWQWIVRWGQGPPVAQRFGFWRWALQRRVGSTRSVVASPNGNASSPFFMRGGRGTQPAATSFSKLEFGDDVVGTSPAIALVVAALRADSTGLLQLAVGLGCASLGVQIAVSVAGNASSIVASASLGGSAASHGASAAVHTPLKPIRQLGLPPLDVLQELLREPFHLQKLWMLSKDSLSWLVRQGRVFQVLLAAHCPALFRHLVTEGVAPELFYCVWLQSLFCDCLEGNDLLRILDLFVLDGSNKIFVRTGIAIFALLEQRLMRGDVEHMMGILLDTVAWGLDSHIVVQKALETKVTRSMLKELEAFDA
eukprot:TRINITY_DN57109_c0_g1_i1.p1 TRINITY_DN57109_c0_g1~~TRINITY_DN57109_c0_g1_i1.p1  ORF type:complete len:978 (-),score=127.43 TRINITY_DN57109_c0_g1_i1:180-3113(-)